MTDSAGLLVGPESTAEKRTVRTPRPGLGRRHRRPDAELSCLVRSRGHHATRPDSADDDRLAAQRRLVALLDRCEERVEVEMQDRSGVTHRSMIAESCPQARSEPRSARTSTLFFMSRKSRTLKKARRGDARTSLPVSKMRGPGDVAVMIPYLLGFQPLESLVLVALEGARKRFGPVLRVDLVDDPDLRREQVERIVGVMGENLIELVARRGVLRGSDPRRPPGATGDGRARRGGHRDRGRLPRGRPSLVVLCLPQPALLQS